MKTDTTSSRGVAFGLRRLFAACLLALAPLAVHAGSSCCSATAPMNPSGFKIQRGVNLSHWLSQDFGWAPREQWITRNDFTYIASLGYDHVRLPVDEQELWHEDGSRNEAAFALLDQALDWAAEHELRVIVDLHTVRTHHFNAVNEGGHNTLFTDPAAQQAVIDLWRDLSASIGDHPVDQVAYEIMNEPVADDPADWNHLVAIVSAAIRELEPDRVLIIGSNLWQLPMTFPHLEVPEGDANIILSTHTYAPLPFTHYKANWTPCRDYDGPIQYPGQVIPPDALEAVLAQTDDTAKPLFLSAAEQWDADRIEKELQPAIDRARELGLQLYCGEFGCMPAVSPEDRNAYYRDLVSVFARNGMAWANWEYKGDFGIFQWHGAEHLTGAPDLGLIEALLGGPGE